MWLFNIQVLIALLLGNYCHLAAAVRVTQTDLNAYYGREGLILDKLIWLFDRLTRSPEGDYCVGWDPTFEDSIQDIVSQRWRNAGRAGQPPPRAPCFLTQINTWLQRSEALADKIGFVDYVQVMEQTPQELLHRPWNYRFRNFQAQNRALRDLDDVIKAIKVVGKFPTFIPRGFYKGEDHGNERRKGRIVEILEHFVSYIYVEMEDELTTRAGVVAYLFQEELVEPAQLPDDGTRRRNFIYDVNPAGAWKYATGVSVIWDGLYFILSILDLSVTSFRRRIPRNAMAGLLIAWRDEFVGIHNWLTHYMAILEAIKVECQELRPLLPALSRTRAPLPRRIPAPQPMQIEPGANANNVADENVILPEVIQNAPAENQAEDTGNQAQEGQIVAEDAAEEEADSQIAQAGSPIIEEDASNPN